VEIAISHPFSDFLGGEPWFYITNFLRRGERRVEGRRGVELFR